MARVAHYRVHGAPPDRALRMGEQVEALAAARAWRGESPWLATDGSSALFEMEYLRLQRLEHGDTVSGAGFVRLAGDEIDALVLAVFLRDLSREHRVRTVLRDDGNPIAKLRYLELVDGRLASGNSLEEMLTRRPVIKKVGGQAIQFYPPAHRLHTAAPFHADEWGYGLRGLRAYAPTLLEAEREALKILKGWRRLGDG